MMNTLSAYFLSFPFLLHAFIIFLLIGSVFSLVVGIGILLRNPAVFRLIDYANRYVSTRRGIKAAEIPRNVEPALYRQRKLLGTVIILGALIALVLLLNDTMERRLLLLIGGASPNMKELWIASSVKWLLVAGNAACLTVGMMLHFHPDALAKIEAVVNQWHSMRQRTSAMEKMYMEVDNWVIQHPVMSGSFIIFLSLNIAVVMYTHL